MNDKRKIPPYSYGYAKSTYEKLEKYEMSTTIPFIKEESGTGTFRKDGNAYGIYVGIDIDNLRICHSFHFLSELHFDRRASHRCRHNLFGYNDYFRIAVRTISSG